MKMTIHYVWLFDSRENFLTDLCPTWNLMTFLKVISTLELCCWLNADKTKTFLHVQHLLSVTTHMIQVHWKKKKERKKELHFRQNEHFLKALCHKITFQCCVVGFLIVEYISLYCKCCQVQDCHCFPSIKCSRRYCPFSDCRKKTPSVVTELLCDGKEQKKNGSCWKYLCCNRHWFLHSMAMNMRVLFGAKEVITAFSWANSSGVKTLPGKEKQRGKIK